MKISVLNSARTATVDAKKILAASITIETKKVNIDTLLKIVALLPLKVVNIL